MGFEVVVGGEDSGADEFFLEDCDEVEEVFGMVVADVVECVGWDGQVVVAVAFFGCVLHHSDDAFYDVVDVGEVALAVAVVEYLYGLAFDKFVGEAEVGHIGASCGAVYESPVAGDADVILVPNIQVGNVLGKAITVIAEGNMAGFVVGAKVPIVFTSRGSSAKEKYLSLVLASAVTAGK